MPAGVRDDQIGVERGDRLQARGLAQPHAGPVVDPLAHLGDDPILVVVVGDPDRAHPNRGERVDEGELQRDHPLWLTLDRGLAEVVGDDARLLAACGLVGPAGLALAGRRPRRAGLAA
ncbi:MAG: hypothetical protein ACRD0K_06245 [Egibacteraceae bacterium]